MTLKRGWSTRLRLVAPLAAAAALSVRQIPTLAQDATPAVSAGSQLGSMLGVLPVPSATASAALQLGTFADLAAEEAAVGVAPPASVGESAPDDWLAAIAALAIADPFGTNFFRLGRSLLGFDLTDVTQTLQAGDPPEMVTLVRGRFDRAAIAAAWTANGYTMLTVDGFPVASLSADDSFDVTNPLQRIVLNRMNNAALLPDGTLAYTASLDGMKAVIATAAGAAPSLARRADVAGLLNGIDLTLASAMLISGAALTLALLFPPNTAAAVEKVEHAFATEVAVAGRMPPIALGLFGMTPGGPLNVLPNATPVAAPAGTVVMRLLLAEAGAAEEAKRVIEGRMQSYVSFVSLEPLTDFFSSWTVRALPSGDVVQIELKPSGSRPINIWKQMVLYRDLGFIAW
jgi:hypothetical protein